MTEQLSLRLDPALPRPGSVAPMWPVPRRDPFDSADYLFGPAWGGHRVLAFIEPGGSVRLVDAAGRDVGPRMPELAGIAGRIDARSAVLDGELVAADGRGRADDRALLERLAGRDGRPVVLLVFDVLHLDGSWLLGKPLDQRRAALRRLVLHGSGDVVVVPSVAGEGRALHAAAAAQGIAGVLARRRTSPYLPGIRSRLWRSIAVRPAADEAAETDVRADAMEPGGIPAGAPVLAVLSRLPLDADEG